MINMDFSEVKIETYELVSPGFHEFEITQVKDNLDTDKPHIMFTLTCNDGSEDDGRKLFNRVSFGTDGAQKAAKCFLQHILKEELTGKLSEYSWASDWTELEGLSVEGDVKHTPSGDNVYANLEVFKLSQPGDE